MSVNGTGRFSHLTYGTGKAKKTNVLGANPNSMDWNGPIQCNDPSHEFPNMLVIPFGQSYTHTCPNCGNTITQTSSNVTL